LTEKIYLDEWDNIGTVREKLEAAESSRVLVIIPARCRAMRNLVNLKLMGRYAEDLHLRLRVVAEDLATKALAKDAGLSVAPVILLGLEVPWLRGSARARGTTSAIRPARRARSQDESKGLLVGIGMAAVILGLVLGALVVFLPTATITLVPVSVPVSGRLDIMAEWGLDEIDYGRAQVPARWVEIEVEGQNEIPTTGVMDVPDGHAHGEVVFANRSSDPLLVPKGTIVRTGSGVNVRFFTVSDVELPAVLWGHARVGIVAIEPGPSGNVKALTINTVEGPLEFLADVLNDAPTTGGTIKRVSIVAPQDYNRLRDSLVQRLQQEAYSRLVEQLDEGEFIPSESVKVEITDEEFAQRIGDQAEILRGRMLLKVGGLAADGSSANLLLRQLMERNIPDGYCLRDETLRFRDVGTVQVGSGVVRFTRVGSGEAMSCADEDALIAALRGKSLKAAGVYLMQHLDLEEPPVISAIPAVYGRIPLLSQRIAIRIVPRSD